MKRKPTTDFIGHKLVLIEWVDTCRLDSGWMDLSDIPEPPSHKCVSVGFLISETDEAKIAVSTIGNISHPANSHTYGGMMIPKSAIVSEKQLR